MNDRYKASPSVSQLLATIVATVLIGSVAVVGTVGQAQASPIQIAAQPHG